MSTSELNGSILILGAKPRAPGQVPLASHWKRWLYTMYAPIVCLSFYGILQGHLLRGT